MAAPRMPSASHAPSSLPARILATGGIAGLLALTCADPGASRMWSTPWTFLLGAVLAVPVLGLATRAVAAHRLFHLPSRGWLLLAAGVAAGFVASSLASPWRAPSLLVGAVPVAAAALFLLLHDWLAAAPERHRLLLARALAAGFAVIAGISFALWLGDVIVATRDNPFTTVLAVWRNPHPLGHSNYTAGLMLLGLPWLLLAAWRDGGWQRGAAIAGAVLALANLFTSGSRGGLLGLGVLGLGAVLTARLPRRRLVPLALAGLVAATVFVVANPRIRSLLRSPDPAAVPNLSTVQRAAMLEAGLLMGTDRPLLGWGPGATPLAYPRYRAQLDGGAENVLQLHNTVVQLWAENGAAGLLLCLGLVVLVAQHRRRDPVAALTLLGYGAFSLTDYQLDVPVFAATVAALAALLAPPVAAPAEVGPRRAVAGVALGLAALVALLGGRDPAPALNTKALALARDLAQRDQAVALFRQSLALNPDQEIAHFNLGWLLVMRDPAAAEKHFTAAARLVPDKGGVYFGLGLARLGQGNRAGAARAFALECANEPLFLASPWWNEPAIASTREATRAEYLKALGPPYPTSKSPDAWRAAVQSQLRSLAPRLGTVSPGPEKAYQRDRLGYPVLMRDLDLPVPTDLYVVREDPRFPDSLPFSLPSKGWLPAARLLNLLDAPAP
jgi:tetratricopeptide (TPR) repeat protein